MKRNALIMLALLMAFSFGCGNSGQKKGQGTEQMPPQGGGPGGPGMRERGGRFSAEDMAKRQTEQLGKFVTFTEGQEAKIMEVNKKFAEKMMEMRAGGRGSEMSDAERQDMRAQMEQLQADKDKEIRSILSSDQAAKYDEYLQDMHKRMQERMKQRPPQN